MPDLPADPRAEQQGSAYYHRGGYRRPSSSDLRTLYNAYWGTGWIALGVLACHLVIQAATFMTEPTLETLALELAANAVVAVIAAWLLAPQLQRVKAIIGWSDQRVRVMLGATLLAGLVFCGILVLLIPVIVLMLALQKQGLNVSWLLGPLPWEYRQRMAELQAEEEAEIENRPVVPS